MVRSAEDVQATGATMPGAMAVSWWKMMALTTALSCSGDTWPRFGKAETGIPDLELLQTFSLLSGTNSSGDKHPRIDLSSTNFGGWPRRLENM